VLIKWKVKILILVQTFKELCICTYILWYTFKI